MNYLNRPVFCCHKVFRNLFSLIIPVIVISILIQTAALACTIFTASDSNSVLAGNNEDYWLDGYIHFTPAAEGYYGRVTFGFDNGWSQGGINERGLFYDWAALESLPWTYNNQRSPNTGLYIRGNYQICELMLAACATVEEAIHIFETINEPSFGSAHILIADSTGASAVIEWGINDIIVIRKGQPYQVITNFNFTNQPDRLPNDLRYNTAVNYLKDKKEISTDLFRRTLKAVSQSITEYSNIFDLKNGIIYLFTDRNFDEYITINIKDELQKGERDFKINTLFAGISHLAPTAGRLVETNPVNLHWYGKNTGYELFCSTDSLFTDVPAIKLDSTSTGHSVLFSPEPSKDYFWKVKAKTTPYFISETILFKFKTAAQLTSVTGSLNLPKDFQLNQNYPNPFNPETVISYQLPANSLVVLDVFDMLGCKVTTLVNEVQNAGSYEVKFKGKNLASGLYLYRAKAGNFAETKKMILMK